MKKCSPSYGQNIQLVHWWVLVHSDPFSLEEVLRRIASLQTRVDVQVDQIVSYDMI